MTGSCTSTSTSSWPRSRSCAGRSSRAARSSWAATATRRGRARWWRPRPTRRGRSGCARGCRSHGRPQCPDAVFLPSDHPAYDAASAEVMAALRSFGVAVEVWGWDEAFVGVAPRPRGLRPARPSDGARPDPAALRGRHRRDEAPGQDGDRLRQARRRRPPDPPHVAPDDGSTSRSPRSGASAPGPRPGSASSASSPSPSSRPPTTTSWPAGSARRSAPTCGCSASAATTRPSSTSRTCPGRAAGR